MSVSLASLAKLYPWAVDPSDDLQRSIGFLGWETPATRLLRTSYGLAVVGCFLTVATVLVTPAGIRAPVTIAVGTVTLLATSLVTAAPQLLATARRTRALGDAPGLVGRAVLSMRLSLSPERAAVFAAGDLETALGRSLARHSRWVRATNERALDSFAGAWREWFPALERSLTLVLAAGEMEPGARDETLYHALDVILDGTRSQMCEFAKDIRGPVTTLYAFGILLPPALVALHPAAAAAGLPLSAVGIALGYDLLLPALLVVAAVWLLAKRPATFPPPRVRDLHPDVPDRTAKALVAGAVVAVVSWLVTTAVFPPWASPLAALSFGGGVALLLKYHPYLELHEEVRTIEDGLTDALTLIGRRVSTGRSVEAAVADAAEELTGSIGTVCEDATTTQR